MEVTEISPPLLNGIQRFGALIACDLKREEITYVSDAIAGVLGQTPDNLLGARVASVMPHEFMHELRNIMSLRHFAEGRHFAGRYDLPLGARDISVSQSTTSGHIVIEFETASDYLHSADDFAAELRHLSGGLRAAVDDGRLLKTFASLLRFATGYDSALVYRFGPHGGEVVAEAGRISQRRFLGDRLSYLENSPDSKPEVSHPILHFTVDADQSATPILILNGASGELDLSHCQLRGTSGADVDALAEMGARAAMTLPIVMNSGIWGMALLISKDPQTPSRYVRNLCDALALVVCDRLEIMGQSTTTQPAGVASRSADQLDFSDKTVLVVEDNRLIAADLKLTLLDLGFSNVVVFGEEASALGYLDANQVDLGVLDVHLEGTSTSFGVARKLAEVGAPFLFASGYGATADLPDWLGPRPVVLKPASKRDLSACIDELLDVGLTKPHQKQVM